eukprot:5988865-Pleurochrysis_carterae.AAC.1
MTRARSPSFASLPPFAHSSPPRPSCSLPLPPFRYSPSTHAPALSPRFLLCAVISVRGCSRACMRGPAFFLVRAVQAVRLRLRGRVRA